MVTIIVILVALWLLGVIHVPWFSPSMINLHQVLFSINGRGISLVEVIIAFILIYVVEKLPSPFRQITVVLALLWVLSVVGLITIANFNTIVIVAIIVGLIISLFGQ